MDGPREEVLGAAELQADAPTLPGQGPAEPAAGEQAPFLVKARAKRIKLPAELIGRLRLLQLANMLIAEEWHWDVVARIVVLPSSKLCIRCNRARARQGQPTHLSPEMLHAFATV